MHNIKNNILTKLCVLFFVLFCVNSVYAQVQVSPLTNFETWNITILGVQTDDYESLSEIQKQVAFSLHPILSTVIKEVTDRHLSTQEKQVARTLKKADALSILSNQLTQKINADDTEALANENLDIWEKRISTRKERKAIEKRIKKVQKTRLEDIEVPDILPIQYLEQTDNLVISNVEDYRKLSIDLKAHSLFFYKLFPLDNFVIIELYEYNILSQSVQKILQTVIDPKNIVQIYTSLQFSLHSIILGTESASLHIAVQTKESKVLYDATIILDGEVVGYGEIIFPVLTAGTHVITTVYNSMQRNEVIALKNKEKALRTYLFEIEVTDTITIQSTPSNSKVYINSDWVGFTPVVIPKPNSFVQLEITQLGYETHRNSISKNSENSYSIELTPLNPIPLEERIKTDRRKFYNAFAAFGISLAVPIVLNGLYVNEFNANSVAPELLSPEGYSESIQRQDAYFYSYLGGVGISTGLGIFTYIRLRKYLNTASEYQDR